MAGLLLAACAVVMAPASAGAAAPTRIMPLGDSITGSPGCWRALLWRHLQDTGHTNVDFVGTLPPQGCGFTYDGENEGHGGILATGIVRDNQLPGWLSATRPDIVLMHLGTNDVWNNIPTSTILDAYTTMLGQMRAGNPAIKLVVARIIPMNPANCAACGQRVVDLDNAIPGWAQAHTTAASPVTVVDQWTGFDTAADTTDGVHPNSTTGIQKMESRWYPALVAALPTAGGGDTRPPSTPGAPTVTAVTASSAALTWTASTDDVGVAGYEVYRAAGASGGTFTLVASPATTAFTDTGLAASTTYRYQVRARDAAGNVSASSGTTAVTTQPEAGAGASCTVSYSASNWGGGNGFTAGVTIANTGTSTVDGWTLAFTYTAGQRITMPGWGATFAQSGNGDVTVTNLTWNAALAPNASTSVGFNGTYSGSNPAPTSFTLNGNTCATT